MDILSFVSGLISSLAWPTVVVVALILLRKEIRLLIPSLQKLKYKDLELDFGRKVEQLEQRAEQANLPPVPKQLALPAPRRIDETIEQLIKVSPRLAIIESFNYVEDSVRKAAIKHGVMKAELIGVRNAARVLKDKGLISESMYSLLHDLRMLRNEASHSVTLEVSPEDAKKYSEQAIRLASAFDNI